VAELEIVVMLLTVAVCLLAAIALVAVLLLGALTQVLHVLAAQNLHLIEWKEKFDEMFVTMDEYDSDDSEEEEIRGWK